MTRGRGDAQRGRHDDAATRHLRDVASPLPRVSEHWRAAWQQLDAAGIDPGEARLEAEVLLRHVLGSDRATFLARRQEAMPAEAAQRFADLIERRLAREPLAYITGHREFFGLDFLVDRRVLIPRPETEGLVERAIATAGRLSRTQRLTIADVGTGSGCIAIALTARLLQAQVVAIDVSVEALALAQENAQRLAVAGRISFLDGDLLQPLAGRADLIVSNPPYIAGAAIDTLQPEIARFEPRRALDGGSDGLDAIRRLLAQAPAHVQPGGAVLVEFGEGQGTAVAALARAAFPSARVAVENDLAGLERYLIVTTGAEDA